jgi:hypothetical protein
MEKVLQWISTLQTEGGLEPSDLLLAFLVAHVSPLQRRSHKMCFLGSAKDPTRHSSKALSALEVAQKANRIADVRLQSSWTWGLEPHDGDNPIAEVSLPSSASFFPPPCNSDHLTSAYSVQAELVRPTSCGEFGPAPVRLCH